MRQRGQDLWTGRPSPSTDMATLHLAIVSCVFVLAIAVAVAVAVLA